MRRRKPLPSEEVSARIRAAEQERRDVELAQERLGQTIDKRLRWAFTFAERDPRELSSGERLLRRDELVALASGLFGQFSPAPGQHQRQSFDVPPTDAEVLAVWRQLRTGLDTLNAGEAWALPPTQPVLDPTVVRAIGGQGVTITARYTTEGLLPAVLGEVGRLLVACRRLKKCPECKRLFVANRRQLRHPKCSQRAKDRKRRKGGA